MRLGTRSLLLVVLLAAGCSSGSTDRAAPSPTPPATTAAPSPTGSPSPQPICPNQESGGSCLGALSAGPHRTEAFAASFSYTSPARWSNEEDINGRYLLLPPGSTRTGAEDATSDYIGAYTPVMAAAVDCREDAEPGVGTSPEQIAAALVKRPGLAATAPKPVTLGTLKGTVVDLRLATGSVQGCPDDPTVPVVTTIYGGYRPELIAHAVIKKAVVRLYLLTSPSAGTVAVELQDASGGAHLASLDAVAQTFVFT